MKVRVIVSSMAVVAFLAASTSASADKLKISNQSTNAIAVGGKTTSEGSILGKFKNKGGRAYAGSVLVDSCDCFDKIKIRNKSNGAIAVGNASAGSVAVVSW